MTRQVKILTLIKELCRKEHAVSYNTIGRALVRGGHVQKPVGRVSNYCFFAASIVDSLWKRKLVNYIHSSKDQWAIKLWFVTSRGKAEIEAAQTAT